MPLHPKHGLEGASSLVKPKASRSRRRAQSRGGWTSVSGSDAHGQVGALHPLLGEELLRAYFSPPVPGMTRLPRPRQLGGLQEKTCMRCSAGEPGTDRRACRTDRPAAWRRQGALDLEAMWLCPAQGRPSGASRGTMTLPLPFLPDVLDSAVGGKHVGLGALQQALSSPPDHRLPPSLPGP